MSVINKLINVKQAFLIFVSILIIRPALAMIAMYIKCRGGLYPRSNVERFPVPDEKVGWSVEYENYKPVYHSASSLHSRPWDPEIGQKDFKPNWNSIDGDVIRVSYLGQYEIQNAYPLNPVGRTGIVGRGVLRSWGPNHGADAIVTRWKTLDTGDIARDGNNRAVLQFIAIKRGDTGELALPGGMVETGETVAEAAVREFQEEATNCLVMTEEEKKDWDWRFRKFFSGGKAVYKGYMDDHRNTDNAWIESVAYSFHDDTGATVGALSLNPGDDAVGVQWADITPQLKLYVNHKQKVDEAYKRITNTI